MNSIRTLFPGYPALVMATGIVAVACDQQGLAWAAGALFAISVIAYLSLAVMNLLRVTRFPAEFVADLTDPSRGYAFLTFVAATNVVGSASLVIHGWVNVAWALWWTSLPLLAIFLYPPLIAGIVRQNSPDLRRGINGTWFLLTVSVESVAVLGGLLLKHDPSELLAFVATGAFGLGLILYLVVMTLIFARWTFTPLDPDEIHPPAWIAAGAVAITTLAGSNLVAAAPQSDLIARVVPFLEGATLAAWATATFWFPVMVALGVWRHLIRRVPLVYDPSLWSMVFPLGMYSAATFAMLGAIKLPEVDFLPEVALVIAAAAWLAAAAGLIRRLVARRG